MRGWNSNYLRASYPENSVEQDLLSSFTYLPQSEHTEIMARLEELILRLRKSDKHVETDKVNSDPLLDMDMEHDTPLMGTESNPLPDWKEALSENTAGPLPSISQNPPSNGCVFTETGRSLDIIEKAD
ncbi:UNVERIFIED_CONTAM: hypothetical protein K2H54_066914 [Gekko kuhli]